MRHDKRFQNGRRRFLFTLGAVSAAGAFPAAALGAKQRQPLKKPIPSSGEKLPVIGMGTSRTFDAGNDVVVRAQLAEVLQSFFDHGGGLIDSSPMYGTSEEVLGALLKGTRNKDALFAATKVWTYGKQAGIEQMEQSRNLWGVARFDLMQIHNLRDWEIHLETLKEWKSQGKIRYLGITTSHGRYHEELERAMQRERFDFVQFSYNIIDRVVEQRLLPLAAERGVATLINRPFQKAELFGKVRGKSLPPWANEFDCASWAQFFLKFVVSHPHVTCVIPATAKLKHMVDNMAAGFGRLPDAKMRQRMIAHIGSL
jgi:diketogulonate reductase-like aldo/keto reductase